MQETDELAGNNTALRDRMARLNDAILGINQSLDFDTVLQAVLDQAKALAGARFGMVAILDESGKPRESAASGIRNEEVHISLDTAAGVQEPGLLDLIRNPLRLGNLRRYFLDCGLPASILPAPSNDAIPLLCVPLYCMEERVGVIFLGEKDGGEELSQSDEDWLVMFAPHAASAIANARRQREEIRARTGLQSLINALPVGVAIIDPQSGSAVSLNLESMRIGEILATPDTAPENVAGSILVRRADGSEIPLTEIPSNLAQNLGEGVRGGKLIVTGPSGATLPALVKTTRVYSDRGEIESLAVTVEDLTPVEEPDSSRVEFLGLVSHQLRTPIAAIRGAASTVLEAHSNVDPSEMRQFFRIIVEQADGMRALINDLADVAAMDAGSPPVFPGPARVSDLVDEARIAFVRGGGRHVLRFSLQQDLPMVMVDQRRIVQVLGVLLSTAAQYAPEGSEMRVDAMGDDSHVAVSVTHHGSWALPELTPPLFRGFSGRNDGEKADRAGGPGSSLAMCKRIVEAHGGKIWAENDGPGRGTRITFTLPAASGGDTGGEVDYHPNGASSAAVPRSSVRVLAVDDDPQTLQQIRDALDRAGYDPIVTADPSEVVHIVANERPDLVLLDLMLPGTDGIALMQRIQRSSDVPVILLSKHGREDVLADAFDKGASDYVIKPLSDTELAARIGAVLRRIKRASSQEPYTLGDLVVDFRLRQATLAGRRISLTATEYRLLAELCLNQGMTLTHAQLLERVWHSYTEGDARPVRTVVKNLRRKLGDDVGKSRYIFTEPRVGYRMPVSEERSAAI